MSEETNWKEIAMTLAKRVHFAISNLRQSSGSGMMIAKDGKFQHWKGYFADALESIPGVEIDRSALHKSNKKKKEVAK